MTTDYGALSQALKISNVQQSLVLLVCPLLYSSSLELKVEGISELYFVQCLHGGPNDSTTRPLARPFAPLLAQLTRSLAPDCLLRSHSPLRSLVHLFAYFAHSLAREKVSY